MDCRNNGLSEQWTVGTMDCRNNVKYVVSEQWDVGIVGRLLVPTPLCVGT